MAQGLALTRRIKMLDKINSEFKLDKVDLRSYSPLALAFIGDSIFAAVVKTVIIERGNCQGSKLHQYSAHIVKAESQALMYDKWQDILSEDELSVMRRGHNAKSANSAKHASLKEYHKATGVEALIGYLFLKGDEDRICELIHMGISLIEA